MARPSTPNAANIDELGDHELGKRSIPGSFGQIALLLVFVAFTDFPRVQPGLLLVLGGLILIANLLRLYLGVRQRSVYLRRPREWRLLFASSIVVPGLAWGILFFSVLRAHGLVHYSTTVALLIGSGVSAGIVASVSPNRRLGHAFLLLILGIPLVALVIAMDAKALGLAIIFLTYYLFLASQLEIYHRGFWSDLRNREKIHEERNRLLAVVDAIPGLVCWFGPELRIHGVNRNYARYYGGPVEEFAGKDLFFRNPDQEFIKALISFAESGEEQRGLEVSLSAGKEPRRHLAVARRTGTGEVYVICIDIEDLKRAESQLEQERLGAELSSKLAALGEISANVAHELRNPLTVVASTAELLQRRSGPGSGAERILSACTRMGKLIDGLKSFSRKTEGEPYVPTSVEAIVRDSVELVEQHFRTHRVALELEPIAPTIGVLCRPIEISQVLVNLLNNALDAAAQQQDRWVRLEVREQRGTVRILLCDSGAGIPQPLAEQVFDPFFTTKPVGKGTGLGLSISRKIVERHGGALKLDRAAAHTTFVIELPAVAVPAARSA